MARATLPSVNPAVFPIRAWLILLAVLGVSGMTAGMAASFYPVPDQLWYEATYPPSITVMPYDRATPETQITARLARASGPLPEIRVELLYLGSPARGYVFSCLGYPQAGSYEIELTATNHLATNRLTFGILVRPLIFWPDRDPVEGSGGGLELIGFGGNGELVLAGQPVAPGGPPRIIYQQTGTPGQIPAYRAGLLDAMVWDDLDGDGLPDPITFSLPQARSLFWNVAIYPGYPKTYPGITTVFESPVPVTPGATALSGDFDGDGDRDIVLINRPGGKPGAGVHLGRNRGTGELDYERVGDAVPNAVAAAGDLDGDGDLDLVMASIEPDGTPTLAVWTNDGRGHFARSPMKLPTGNFVGIGLADFDGDGRLDLWTEEHIPGHDAASQTNRLAVLLSTADGFRESWAIETPIGHTATATAAACDFDGDGFADLVGVGPWRDAPARFVFLNDGRGRFQNSIYLGDYSTDGKPAVGDFNGDSRPDIVFGPHYPFSNGVFTNLSSSFNIPPSAPPNPRSSLDGDRLVLEWDAASDLNQPGALTYNVRAGSGPGMNDLVPSLARADGVRLVTRPGNAGFRTSLELDISHRAVLTVYWSVQAIDAAGQGGQFSVEETRRIRDGATAPLFVGLHDFSMPENNTGTLAFEVTEPGVPHSDIVVRIVGQPPGMPGFAWISTNGFFFSDPYHHLLWARAPRDVNGVFPIMVAATDPAGISITNRVIVSVAPSNGAPRLGPLISPPRQIYSGESLPPIVVQARDPDSPIGDLVFGATDTLGLIPPENIKVRIVGTNLVEISAPGYPLPVGNSTIRLSASDPQNLGTHLDIPLRVVPHWFEEFSVLPDSGASHLLSLGDYDGDGLPDLLGTTPSGLAIWHNEGTNAWPSQRLELPDGFWFQYAQWDDWDRDGRLDIVCVGSRCSPAGCNPYDMVVCVLYNRPEGWVAGPLLSPSANPSHIVAIADVDDDGKSDVVTVTAPQGANYALEGWLRRGDTFVDSGGIGSATPITQSLPSVGILDLDLDGRTDVVGTSLNQRFHWTGSDWDGSDIRWQFNGNPTFADLDRDGRWDAVVSSAASPGTGSQYLPALANYRRSSQSPFQPLPDTLFRDFDGDGLLDALTHEGNPGLRRGDRENWGAPVTIPSYEGSEWIAGDIDGDGKTDILLLVPGANVGGTNSTRIVVLRNVLASDPGPRPDAPSDARVAFENDGTFLEWSRRSAEIARGTTYNIRVGTAPGLSDVVSPLAKPDGTRLASAPGNAGISPRRRITGLTLGKTYYTAVQCIDDAGRGGPFSTEIAFVPIVPTLAITAPGTVSVAADAPELSMEFDVTNAIGDVLATATFGPSSLAGAALPTTTITGRHGKVRVLLSLGMQGRGKVTIAATDGSHSIARRTIVVVRGEPPAGADFAVVRSLATRIDHPVAFDADPRSLDPGQQWLDSFLAAPDHGTMQTGLPAGYYIPEPGFAGADHFTWTMITGEGDRLDERFNVEVAGTGGTQLYIRKDGGWDLFLVATPSEVGTLEVSDDLLTWRPLTRYEVPASGSVFLHSAGGFAGEAAVFIRRVPDRP